MVFTREARPHEHAPKFLIEKICSYILHPSHLYAIKFGVYTTSKDNKSTKPL
jgi:hypothetical protein